MAVPNAPDSPLITAQDVRHALICARRVWLDAHGDPALRDESAPEMARAFALGVQHEASVRAAVGVAVEYLPVESWAHGVALTRGLMARGVAGIGGACLEHRAPLDLTDRLFTVRGRPDRLLRVAHAGALVYAPVEIKRRREPEAPDWAQLDLYAWLLREVQGIAPPGELWLGATDLGAPARRDPHEYDEERLMDALLRAIAALDASEAPPVRLEAHCKTCPWQTACRAVAEGEESLDLLYSVSRTTRDGLAAAGLARLADIAACAPEDLLAVRGIGPASAPRLRANAQAWVEGRPVWYGALPADLRQGGWMFDLETCEARGKTVPWCMGWCDTAGETQIALVAPVQLPEPLTLPDGQSITLVPDSDTAWEVLAGAMAAQAGPICHWTGYDAGILRGSAPAAALARLEPRMFDLHAAFKRAVSLPLPSTSIKAVAAYLGFVWPENPDWFAAYLDYQFWLESGDEAALARACAYQRADVQSMAWVWRWLVANDPQRPAG
jgi:uncharacterized protein